MRLEIEIDREEDGRWIAEVVQLPGVLATARLANRPSSKPRRSPCAARRSTRSRRAGSRLGPSFRGGPMSRWPSTKARRVLAALYRIGWSLKRQSGSHRILERQGYPDIVFAFHDDQEIGPGMLARIAGRTDVDPNDL